MAISFIKSGDGTISTFIQGKSYVVPTNHHFYVQILEALKKDDEVEFVKLANLKEKVESFAKDVVSGPAYTKLIEVKDDVVFYKGKELHNVITSKILDYIKEGLSPTSLINFLEKLMKNPSKHSVDQLFNFLEHKFLPIHEDGDFFGYKRVRNDYMDFHTGTISNTVGTTVEVERNTVDDDYSVDCSYGLHVGTRDYVMNFHGGDPNSRVLLVKVNPADVVSVPKYDSTKMRVCRYFVFEELDNKEFGINSTVYSPKPVNNSFNHSEDEEEFDEEDEDKYNLYVVDADDDIEIDEEDEDFEDDEDFSIDFEDDEDDEVDFSDLSEWIEEVAQGTMKEDLTYACKKSVAMGSCKSYKEAFLALSKFIHNEGNQSLINFINKTDVRIAFEEIYCVVI